MTLLRPLALVFALGGLLLAPQAAAGGGWWSYIDVNRSTVAPGQRVEIDEAMGFRSIAGAEAAEESGGFYVYLLRDFDYSVVERAMRKQSSGSWGPRNWWSIGDAEAIQVAPVAVSVSDRNLARARATFTVPELAPGSYHLMLCDAGCAEPLADVIPTRDFTIVVDPTIAQLSERVDGLSQSVGSLEKQTRRQARQLDSALAEAEASREAAVEARSEAKELEGRLSSIADEARRSQGVGWWEYGGWLLAGALAGALALPVLRRRWPRTARVARWHPSDEELRDLLASEPPPGDGVSETAAGGSEPRPGPSSRPPTVGPPAR